MDASAVHHAAVPRAVVPRDDGDGEGVVDEGPPADSMVHCLRRNEWRASRRAETSLWSWPRQRRPRSSTKPARGAHDLRLPPLRNFGQGIRFRCRNAGTSGEAYRISCDTRLTLARGHERATAGAAAPSAAARRRRAPGSAFKASSPRMARPEHDEGRPGGASK
jgi:hypothetical protein